MRVWAILLLGCAMACMPARAADERTRSNVTAECQFIVLPQKAALALLPDLVDDSKIDAAFARLMKMVEKDEAQLVANLVVKGIESKKSKTETVDEMRFPTEFDPPQLPPANDLPKDKADAAAVLKNWPIVGFIPTGFLTREIGPSLEIEPISYSSDAGSLELVVTAQDVRFVRWVKYDPVALPDGERLGFEQPWFQTIKSASNLRLRNGQRILLGVHKVPDDKGSMELLILRVSVTAPP